MGEGFLNRDEILAGGEAPYANVLVREWGGTVRVRMISAGERDALDRETVRRRRKAPDRIRVRERLVIACAVNGDGQPLFKPEDEEALSRKPVAGLDRVFRVAAKLNGFVDEDDGDDPGN